MWQLVVKDKEGILALDNYQACHFVSVDQYIVSTPGWLLTSYGRKGDSRRFNSRTIFVDAGTGGIELKIRFPLVLINYNGQDSPWKLHWDLVCAEIKNINIDNNTFTPVVFWEDCAEKCQTQSFSGVGACHQNADVVHAIQTIIHVTCYTALSEYGVNDLALWSFAIKYTTWL